MCSTLLVTTISHSLSISAVAAVHLGWVHRLYVRTFVICYAFLVFGACAVERNATTRQVRQVALSRKIAVSTLVHNRRVNKTPNGQWTRNSM